MRGRYGTKVKVSNDIEQEYRSLPSEVVLTVDQGDALLSPEQARKLAKRLRKQANRVEFANRVRGHNG